MKTIRKQIWNNCLSVQQTESENIKFSWNFKEMANKSQTNFHIFILLSRDPESCFELISEYFLQMRSGDILGLLYSSHRDPKRQKLEWIEKTQLESDDRYLFYKKIKNNQVKNFHQSLAFVLSETAKKKRCVCFVNIIASQQVLNQSVLTLVDLHKILTTKRTQNEIPDNHIVNLLGNHPEPFLNSLSGVNLFPFEPQYPKDICQLLKIYCKHLSIPCLKVWFQMDCKQNISCSESQWKAVGFGALEKTYYGIPSTKFSEELHFVNLGGMKVFRSGMKINLEITHCNGNVWHCQSNFEVNIDLKKVLAQTYYMQRYTHKLVQIGNLEPIMSDFVDKNSFFFVKEI